MLMQTKHEQKSVITLVNTIFGAKKQNSFFS